MRRRPTFMTVAAQRRRSQLRDDGLLALALGQQREGLREWSDVGEDAHQPRTFDAARSIPRHAA